MIFIVGLTIAGFLFSLLVVKKGKASADYILTVWMGVVVIHLLLHYAYSCGLSYAYPHTLGLAMPLPLLHGVLLYFYTGALTGKKPLKPPGIALHLIPCFILIGLAIPFYRLPAPEKARIFQHEGIGFEWYSTIQVIFILVSGFAYAIASVLAIQSYRKSLQQHVSNTDQRMLTWLKYLATGLGIIWGLVVFFDDAVIFSGVVLFVLFIGFFGIHQVPVFNAQWAGDAQSASTDDQLASTPLESSEPVAVIRYAKTGLTKEDALLIMERLEMLMTVEKPYKNSELTLSNLATKLAVHPNQLSQVINSMTRKTFYHYINTCRVDEFLTIAALPENRKYTFLALAYDCGFNAKTTFNKHFKLHTGKTPSDYFSI